MQFQGFLTSGRFNEKGVTITLKTGFESEVVQSLSLLPAPTRESDMGAKVEACIAGIVVVGTIKGVGFDGGGIKIDLLTGNTSSASDFARMAEESGEEDAVPLMIGLTNPQLTLFEKPGGAASALVAEFEKVQAKMEDNRVPIIGGRETTEEDGPWVLKRTAVDAKPGDTALYIFWSKQIPFNNLTEAQLTATELAGRADLGTTYEVITVAQMEAEKSEIEQTSAPAEPGKCYKDPAQSGVIFVGETLNQGQWASFRVEHGKTAFHRVKSRSLPVRISRADVQADLDAWAVAKDLEERAYPDWIA